MSWWWWWQCQYQYQYQLSPVINMCVVCVVYEAEWRVQPKHDWLPRYPAIQTPPQPAQDTPLILQANSEQDSPFNITNCIKYYAYIDTTVFQERFEPLFTPLLVYSETRGGKLWRNFVILFQLWIVGQYYLLLIMRYKKYLGWWYRKRKKVLVISLKR